MEIIFVRHGQSVGNEAGCFCGEFDCELSQNGKVQGELVSDYIFKNYKVCAIYSSALKRAYQTVEKLSKLENLEIIKMKEFNEMFGGKWEGMKVKDIETNFPNDYDKWKTDIGFATPTGGENWKGVYDRCLKGVKTIYNKYSQELRKGLVNGNEVVVVATHGGVIRIMETFLNNLKLEDMKKIPFVPNCSVTKLDVNDDKITILQSGYCDFLGENKTTVPKGI